MNEKSEGKNIGIMWKNLEEIEKKDSEIERKLKKNLMNKWVWEKKESE